MLPRSGNKALWKAAGAGFYQVACVECPQQDGHRMPAGTSTVRMRVHTDLAVVIQRDSRSLTPRS